MMVEGLFLGEVRFSEFTPFLRKTPEGLIGFRFY
jgi:hypothetical protein